ncbi:MAG: hypothetical protein A2493_02095 [Candidatus Magasanikbacteria bacterium RIFOXYC12_FULL_33_11]|uniref:Uncharacterized protein n=1 Tax=Candidatus Magasanikbacteria bacterium RIFOXYC12_FULL_33_11 TaxID=1798701 RepID=A0A1F6NPI6_9BACT|nr:MAG: hypothetical protein A2493_02095 [Candidatus Magasanikbacteria bacterium RIFOXYC12_FULL_33_11]
MKIKKITIHNWRSIKDLTIDCKALMVFIGQNNHGKSNVLSALMYFFGEIDCSEMDFNKGSTELYTEVEFEDLNESDKTTFKKYVTVENTIKVRKQINKNSSSEYHGYCEIPQDDWLKEDKMSSYLNRAVVANTPLNDLLPASGRLRKEDIKEAQDQYILNNKESIIFNYELESTNFLGFKSVASNIFGEVYFIPAVKDARDEFNIKGKSTFNKLLSNVIDEMSYENKSYIAAKDKIAELTQSLNKTVSDGSVNENRPEQICVLEESIENELKKWNTTINIEIIPPNIDELLKVGTNVWVDDGIPTDINRKGNGLQRALIFALIKSWAKITIDKLTKKTENEENDIARQVSSSSYYIFEEPELYLHPQAQKELYSSLKELSEANNQVLITTHSSSFIDLKRYKSICIIYKNDTDEGTKKLQCTEELFSSADEKKNFNLAYWINPDRGELFFAKKVVLLEGQTEKTVLPYLAHQIDIFRYDYTILDCAGKDNIKYYIELLNKFNLPYVAVYDKDHQSYKTTDDKNKADISSRLIEEKINDQLGSSVILNNDIEEEIGITDRDKKNKPYIALQKISDDSFVITEQLKEKITRIFT